MAARLARLTWTPPMSRDRRHSGPSRILLEMCKKVKIIYSSSTCIWSSFNADSVDGVVQVLILLGTFHQVLILLGHKIITFVLLGRKNSSSAHCNTTLRSRPRSWMSPCCWSRTCKRQRATARGCRCPPPGRAGTLGSGTENFFRFTVVDWSKARITVRIMQGLKLNNLYLGFNPKKKFISICGFKVLPEDWLLFDFVFPVHIWFPYGSRHLWEDTTLDELMDTWCGNCVTLLANVLKCKQM